MTGNPRAAYHQCETLHCSPAALKETLPSDAPVMSNSSDLSENAKQNERKRKSYGMNTGNPRAAIVKHYPMPVLKETLPIAAPVVDQYKASANIKQI